ncbi:MAG: hypothetical protein M3319_05930, partial [Actinomycetota bacterium]|nr:hypothetical protein [Actinomycetota bacterium]
HPLPRPGRCARGRRRLGRARLAGGSAEPDHALTLLRAGLLPLYLHYLDDHAGRLTAARRPELAEKFGQWRTRLVD